MVRFIYLRREWVHGVPCLPTIDINTVKDDLSGPWWHIIKADDFLLAENIDMTAVGNVVSEGDVLVHKQVLPGEHYPSVRYHEVQHHGSTRQVTNVEVREHLGKKLLAFIEKTGHLPPHCTFIKRFKNDSVQIDFKPSKDLAFALKIVPGSSKIPGLDAMIDSMQAMLPRSQLLAATPTATQPSTAQAVTATVTSNQPGGVDPLAIPKHITRMQGTVGLIDGEVVQVERRTGSFQDHPVTYFLHACLAPREVRAPRHRRVRDQVRTMRYHAEIPEAGRVDRITGDERRAARHENTRREGHGVG
ncbi:MAG: hypothetical protein GYA24_12660 [Candidatus Lokiarchaeota archaeon]|nr:hypothetical protein [Candidatus Lokiarchaeota archaeon]